MPEFQLTTEYTPAGDQPQAIAGLTEGLRAAERFQTLLGVTGSGKSLAPEEPVWIEEESEGRMVPRLVPIGTLVDAALAAGGAVERDGDREIVRFAPGSSRWRAFSVDPERLRTEPQPITAMHRHRAPANLWRVTTACGREARVTGDHNLWVLRGGRLRLLETSAVRSGDYLPLPCDLPAPDVPLDTIVLMDALAGARVFMQCQETLTQVPRARLREVARAISLPRPNARERLRSAIAYADRLPLADARALEARGVDLDLANRRVSVQHGRRDVPLTLPVSNAFLELLGSFIAEGHAEQRYFLVSCDEAELQDRLQECLTALGLPWRVRRNGYDYVVTCTLHTRLLSRWCGARARKKKLPDFWPALDQAQLATLLAAYFSGDGGVEHDAVTTVTASRQLASDLCYALARFGIHARVARCFKRATNSKHAGDHYYRLTISGAEQLERFAERVGFTLERKRRKLNEALGKASNTNVDLIPLDGTELRRLRAALGWLQRDLATRAGCDRALISMIESGRRRPSRRLFGRLIEAFRLGATEQGQADLARMVEDLARLGRVRWTPVRSVVEEPAGCEWVYDLSVAGNETFLGGFGGVFVHNTFTMAGVIEKVQRPTLVIAHNKTLAAQLCSEFRQFFPQNSVEYFVSYYDYYQPEAYIPQTDTYIEKDSAINDEIDRLRHSSTQAVLERRDVIVVASVSCIYGLGSPQEYQETILSLVRGEAHDRRRLLRRLVDMQFQRNDMALTRGTFCVKGDILEVCPADEEIVIRVDFFGDEIEKIEALNPTTGEVLRGLDRYTIFPASHFVTSRERLERAIESILAELEERLDYFRRHGQLLEAQRLEQRTMYDVEMMREVGYCNGIENYSRHMDGRPPGTPPHTLLDYFPDDFLLMIDESHQTIPQIHGMYGGDMSRKDNLVDFGFRLPSARDNRPLKWEEFEGKLRQAVFVSATPGPFERQVSSRVVEQIVRPTGLIDPEVEVRPTRGQIDDLVGEIRGRIDAGERVLVTTLTKKMAEDLSEYLINLNIKVHYLHSDIKTLERLEILRDLRLGVHDVIVGINLLREGLDLPEVSLVAILDADKEGFLRSDTSLIQSIGRAARNVQGKVIMYADAITGSMRRALDETARRRAKQLAHNVEQGITPATVRKAIRDVLHPDRVAEGRATYRVAPDAAAEQLPLDDLLQAIEEMEAEMKRAARALEFEAAARMRDEINRLKKLLPDAQFAATVAPMGHPPARPRGR